MKLATLALALLPLAPAAMHAQAPTIDYPTGADWTTVTRPSGSIVSGAMHIDMDEYYVPLSAPNGDSFAKTVTAKGPVDYLAYAGPATTSTLENHDRITAQLIAEGYKPLWTCVRTQCNGYGFATAISNPLVDSMNNAPYHNLIIDSIWSTVGDVRYTAFQKDNEYLTVTSTLSPGKFSGVLLTNVNGKNAVPQSTPHTNRKPQTSAENTDPNSTTNTTSNAVKSQVKSRIGGWLNR